MKKLIPLYAIVFAFGMVFGYLKNNSWNIHDWGYNSSKYVSLWWISMGCIVTVYCVAESFMKSKKNERE